MISEIGTRAWHVSNTLPLILTRKEGPLPHPHSLIPLNYLRTVDHRRQRASAWGITDSSIAQEQRAWTRPSSKDEAVECARCAASCWKSKRSQNPKANGVFTVLPAASVVRSMIVVRINVVRSTAP